MRAPEKRKIVVHINAYSRVSTQIDRIARKKRGSKRKFGLNAVIEIMEVRTIGIARKKREG